MDITNYIASGMIEGYLFGLANAEERAEFERRLKIEPELQDEYIKAQQLLKCYTACFAVQFPEDPESIWEKIQASPQVEKSLAHPPAVLQVTPEKVPEKSPEPTPIIFGRTAPKPVHLQPKETEKFHENAEAHRETDITHARSNAKSGWKWIGVFGFLLFIGAAAMALTYKLDRDAIATQLRDVTKLQNEQANLLEKLEQSHALDSAKLSFLMQDGVRVYKLSGDETFMLGWNNATGKIIIWDFHFPAPDSGKKYILWAMKQGKPEVKEVLNDYDRSGTFELTLNLKRSDQFIVTLEAEEVDKPDMEELIAKSN